MRSHESKENTNIKKNRESLLTFTSKNSVHRLILSAFFAALIFIATAFLPKIPMFLGYIHIGDAFIWLAATYLSPVSAAVAAAIGSGIADLTSGYPVWIPATIMIKALSAWIMASYLKMCKKKNYTQNKYRQIIVSCICGVFVAIGYLIYETLLFGFGAAIASFPFNLLQGLTSSVIFSAITFAIYRIKQRQTQ